MPDKVNTIYLYATAITPNAGGSHTILLQLLDDLQQLASKGIHFVLLAPPQYESIAYEKKISFIPLDHNKKWLRRLFWETFLAKKVIPNSTSCSVLSLQNTLPAVGKKVRTIAYLHTTLGFEKTTEVPILHWREVLKKYFYATAVRAHLTTKTILIVQTEWMKALAGPILKIPKDRMFVATPTVKKMSGAIRPPSTPTFFYPAQFYHHKNHQMILQALRCILQTSPTIKMKFIFTIDSFVLSKLKKQYPDVFFSKCIVIENCEYLSHEEVVQAYLKSSALIFPSMLETFGLPLIEARQLGLPILCSDLPYAREALENYPRVAFFNPYQPAAVAESLLQDLPRLENMPPVTDSQKQLAQKRSLVEVIRDLY